MTCPRCGSETTAAASRCPRCAAPMDASVATSVLTPPPGDAEQTRFATAPTSIAGSASDDSPTAFIDPQTPAAFGEPEAAEDSPTAFLGASTIGRAAKAIPASVNGPLQPGQPFGSRYQIIRTLGVGGMGAVYEAYDAELGVAVALKVIRPDVMADPTAAA